MNLFFVFIILLEKAIQRNIILDLYKDNELGRDKFRMNGRNYKRTDFTLT